MKQIETDPKYLAGADAAEAMRRAEAADNSAGGEPYIALSDEQAAAGWGWDAVRKMRDEINAKGDYQPCVYAVQSGGWPVRLLLGDTGWAKQGHDGSVYHFQVQPKTDHGVVEVALRRAFDIPDKNEWQRAPLARLLRYNSSNDFRGFVVWHVKPAEATVTVHKSASCGPTELSGWVEQGGIVEMWAGGACARFKISRVTRSNFLREMGDWKIWEEVGYRASSNWAEMKTLGKFLTHASAFEHLIINGYGLPMGAIDELPGSELDSAPRGRG